MYKLGKIVSFVAVVTTIALAPQITHAGKQMKAGKNPVVRITTNMGTIDVELFAHKAPVTVENFLKYVADGFYNGTIFHRVISGFMIQGGGMQPGMVRKPTHDPITNEADNGLSNATGTIAMARTSDPHSATSQFFINTVDNTALDHKSRSGRGWGYTVFGKVINGMDVVRTIEQTPTERGDVPKKDMLIEKVEVVKPKS